MAFLYRQEHLKKTSGYKFFPNIIVKNKDVKLSMPFPYISRAKS
jgi:hypothetical protein